MRPPTLHALIGILLARTTRAACNEALLREATDRYVASQSTGSLTWLSDLLSNTTTYLENNKLLPLTLTPSPNANTTTTAFATPLRVDHKHSIYDLTQCASFTSLLSTDPAAPRVIGAQLWLTTSSTGSHISKIDRVTTTTGDWLFNATGTLYYSLREDWGVIPSEKRDSRAVIKAAADAYFDIFKDASVQVPWGTPCARLEGGAYTGRGLPTDSCNVGVIQSFDMPNRRYVIDESVGAASLLVEFGSIGNAPDSHLFRVEGGKLRFIHTLTYCEKKPNCGYTIGRPAGGG